MLFLIVASIYFITITIVTILALIFKKNEIEIKLNVYKFGKIIDKTKLDDYFSNRMTRNEIIIPKSILKQKKF